jgi:hypothetical protein
MSVMGEMRSKDEIDAMQHPSHKAAENATLLSASPQGRACPLCLSSSDVGLFGDFESVIHLDAEIPHGALDFGVPEQKLDRSEISGALVDQRGLGPAQRVRAVERGIETDLMQPAVQQPRILAGAHMRLNTATAGEKVPGSVSALCSEIGIHRLAGVLGEFEHHRPAGLLLANGRARDGTALRRNIGDTQADQVAAAQLAVDAEIEQRQIADAAGQL